MFAAEGLSGKEDRYIFGKIGYDYEPEMWYHIEVIYF